MYKDTSKPKHTIANKGSMKALQGFIQTEMKKHDQGEEYIFLVKMQAT